MTELGPILSRLGLAQYFQSFIEEGFDTWETVLDITESDLDALNVKLGHRRRLQREIASARGYTTERLLASPTRSPPVENGRVGGADDKVSGKSDGRAYAGSTGGKRKYRRHPKADENAPERPPSAYVIFSNKIREELRPQNLTFTDIAKRVGESWQVLLAEEKEPYESQASAAKEKYHAEMAKYKKTDAYKEYTQYLADFKAKNATNLEGKRPRLDTEVSTASSTSAGSQAEAPEPLSSTTVAGRSIDTVNTVRMHQALPEYSSPGCVPVSMAPPTMFGGHSSALRAASPGSISSMKTYRRSSMAQESSGMASHIQPSIENSVDRNAEVLQGQPLPRIVPLEARDTRMLPANSSALLTDPSALRGRTSPQHSFRRTNQIPAPFLRQESSISSKSSSIASSLSSVASTTSSGYKPATTLEERRSQRFLPPLSPVDLKSVRGSAYGDSGGQSIYPSLVSNSSSAYTLPPPLNSPFLSSPSSDIAQERRSPKNLTLGGTGSDSGNDLENSSREAQEAQRPPHHPFLPNPHRVSSEKDQRPNVINEDFPHEAFPSSHADPLSVLAFAGRMVDRGGR